MKKVGVVLSGCGVYDGSEIQEAVFTLLAIDRCGAQAVCLAPDMELDELNHLTGGRALHGRSGLCPEKGGVLEDFGVVALDRAHDASLLAKEFANELAEGFIRGAVTAMVDIVFQLVH